MNHRTLSEKAADILVDCKVIVFLVVCLTTHIVFSVMYFSFGISELGILNIISVLFYAALILRGKYTDSAIVQTYFEVIAYSVLSNAVTRGKCGFIFIDSAIIAAITYLIPAYGKKKLIFQLAGFAGCFVMYFERLYLPETFMQDASEKMDIYGNLFMLINMCVTVVLVIYITFIYDVNLERVRKELDYRSTHDALTGLYNRRYLNELVAGLALDSPEDDIIIAMFDIDHFKNINDSFGHDTGDEILVRTSALIKSETGDSVSVRWGGEEFILFFRNCTTAEAYGSVRKICDSIKENVQLPDGRKVTVTSGIKSGRISEFEETVKRVDEYLYHGKNNGRDCIIWDNNAAEA